jgi:hypothetical protein
MNPYKRYDTRVPFIITELGETRVVQVEVVESEEHWLRLRVWASSSKYPSLPHKVCYTKVDAATGRIEVRKADTSSTVIAFPSLQGWTLIEDKNVAQIQTICFVKHLSAVNNSSDKLRIEWCSAVVREIADLGRDKLGDLYPQAVKVAATLNRVLEPNVY